MVEREEYMRKVKILIAKCSGEDISIGINSMNGRHLERLSLSSDVSKIEAEDYIQRYCIGKYVIVRIANYLE
jgi:hypothetical protein